VEVHTQLLLAQVAREAPVVRIAEAQTALTHPLQAKPPLLVVVVVVMVKVAAYTQQVAVVLAADLAVALVTAVTAAEELWGKVTWVEPQVAPGP
jgi:hypothetical protein